MAADLVDDVTDLARAAAATAPPRSAAAFAEVADRLDGPVRLAVAGRVKAGKSTLLNALLGEELAPTDAGECTTVLTWYRWSERPFALLHLRDGTTRERPYERRDGALRVDLGHDPATVDHLEVGWPTSRLRDLVLIDTPGLASLSADLSARTSESLAPASGVPPAADAVLYLMRHAHASDVRFLEAFHDDEVGRGTPVNTVGVLSRADEIGSSRLDAMEVAARVARRYQEEPRLHRLCPVVVPVNGLLGHAAATLREAEFAALRRVASAAPEEVEELLLTADRFASREPAGGVPAPDRVALLDRFGLFGVRLAVELLRRGAVATSTDLAAALAASSGLDRLREVVVVQFEARARLLKARSAVAALRQLLEGERDEALLRRLEELTAGAHELEEVRVLLELRAGDLALEESRAEALDLLMGGSGHDPRVRLGLPPDAAPDLVRATAWEALRSWQQVAHHPLTDRATQRAARAATRSVEGIVAALAG